MPTHESTALPRIVVGYGTCGLAAGAQKVRDAFTTAVQQHQLPWRVATTGCLGNCFAEPVVEVHQRDGRRIYYQRVNVQKAKLIIDQHLVGGQVVERFRFDPEDPSDDGGAFFAKQFPIVLRNCGRIDPESIEDYLAVGGYQALAKALDMGPEAVIDAITHAGLRGRGGAGFSTGRKWRLARDSEAPQKYIICNADEGDPGAFMDRSTIEGDPHAVLEGLAIGGFAIGATQAYVYCRAEYPLAVKRLQTAIQTAKARGYLGDDVLGRGFSFDIKVKEGAGAFVCGEETALMASIEGERGMPRFRPPFPAQRGLWGMPTNINNVETLVNVPWIIQNGPEAFRAVGTAGSPGTKVFALAGRVQRGGLVEVPMGMRLGEVVLDIGGGADSGRTIKAVQLGGPSGGCIPASLFDTRVDYDEVNATGAIMGSGGMVVLDETACMVDIARYFLDFTQKESCGKCTFCRVGTKRMLEILERICSGVAVLRDLDLLEELADRVKRTSLCGLGQTAPNPVLTTLRHFRAEYLAHIVDHKCPAGRCRALCKYTITEACTGCAACVSKCPTGAISGERRQVHQVAADKCISCGVCRDVCRFDAVRVV